jgi:PPOX class probable FMN-dependent enzyme
MEVALYESLTAHQNRWMPETIWVPALVLALYQNRHAPYSRFVQLATVRPDGRPANRTVVFRGFLDETSQLTFVTDARSAKVAELGQSRWAEVCWYFPVTHEQFRIGGPTTLVGAGGHDPPLLDARRACWRELPEAVRLSFTWPAPGERRAPRVPFPTQHPDPTEPLPHFCLLILDPNEVDQLELNGNPQNRWEYTRDEHGRWRGAEINP